MLKRIRILTALLVFALVLSIVPAAYAGSGLPDVTRLAGNTRYETSVLVAETFFTSPTQAVIAYGENFPDGLSGSPLANTVGAPLILTRAGKEAAAAKYVADTGITGGYALGGTTVLPEKTVEKIFPAVTTPEPTECAHTYNNDCDADCNLCCAARTPADHVYDDAYDADCNVCGEGRTPAVRPMQIVQQPQDALIPSGGAEHTFTVVVSGGTEPYSYQWQYQNSLVPEFTDIDEFSRAFCSGFQTASMSLELYSTDFDRGTQFRCIITDARGEKIITNAVKVIENIPPLKITGQPTDVSAEIYDLVVYTVVAEGGKGSYTYQWQFMSNMQPNWMDITHDQGGLYSGYETADLQVNVISDHYNDAYQFRCVVTDSRGESVTSDAAFLHQFVPLTVYVEPRDVYTSTGGYHEFAVTVGSGLPTYTYQWYWKMDGVGMAMPFDGTEGWGAVGYNTATLGLTASTDMLENNFYVFCRISDQSGDEVETRKAYVLQSFEVHTYTASQGMNVGRTVEISVSVRGGKAPYTYQLQRRFGFNDTFKNYGAAKTGYEKSCSVKEKMTQELLDMLPEYRYLITDANGNRIETEPIGFWEYKQFAFTAHPQNQGNVDVGDQATYSVEVSGSEKPFTYQWYSRQADGYTVFEPIEGATEASYTHTFTEADRKYNVEFYCEVTDRHGNVYSGNTVRPTYTLWIKSQSKTFWDLSVSDTPTFVVTPAGGSGTYTYEWEVYFWSIGWNSASTYNWIDEAYKTTSAMKIIWMKDWFGCYQFRCKVSDGTDTVYSEIIEINVN